MAEKKIMEHHNNLFAARFFQAVYTDTIVRESIHKLKSYRLGVYFEDELKKMLYKWFEEYNEYEMKGHIKNFCNTFSSDQSCQIDFFDVMFALSDQMIIRYENQYCFKYKYTDIWKIITSKIGEEPFVISAIVQDDLRRRIAQREKFDWPYCLEHDNNELKSLLRRGVGVSENHFHLRGSSPYFDISWVYLMNNITNSDYDNRIRKIEKNSLNYNSNKNSEYPLCLVWRKAAAIRLLLYLTIRDKHNADDPMKAHNEYSELYEFIMEKVLPYDSKKICTFQFYRIQEKCNSINVSGAMDYAIPNAMTIKSKYYNFVGERYIIYECLKKIRIKEDGYRTIKQLLFLYLIFKHMFFIELIQNNDKIGFDNFNRYQSRKDYFIPWSEEKYVAADTISSLIDNNKIYRAELRISPDKSAQSMSETIHTYEAAIDLAISQSNNKYKLSREENFFYTLHFVKEPDKYQRGQCRHFNLRHEIQQKSEAIFELGLYAISKRIYGIDACGEEMNCRPEVFGSAFRYLQYYEPMEEPGDIPIFNQLKATYHVGEDNYDLLDGLRAIDEAITFLHLHSGCRLGHATLLGINPQEFYKNKNPISIPYQVFLDNVVWMYYFLRENLIEFEESSNLMSYLEEKFRVCFHYIYDEEVKSPRTERILQLYDTANGINVATRSNILEFNLYHYHLSYLLRGDDPELYKDGYYNAPGVASQSYRMCSSNEYMCSARKNFEACYLYYLYHYSYEVVQRGNDIITEKLPDSFIYGLCLVQKKLKQKIADEGIAIETNPTSNLYISIIKDYQNHPISGFFDVGLRKNPGEVQLNVSINTDDKGVFSSSLSNEYAYLLFYLENQKDDNGDRIYSRFEILHWLDDIRKMGNEQSFCI